MATRFGPGSSSPAPRSLTGRVTRSQRPVDLGAARRAGRGGHPHPLRRRPRRRPRGGAAVPRRARASDLIVTSGGLGPTADDLTAEVVARFAGRELVLDEGMEEKIAAILAGFARRLRFDPEALREANRKQAMVPRGATAIDPAGTAPGLVVPTDGPHGDRPARAAARAAGDVAARRSRPSPCARCSSRATAVSGLHAAPVRHPRVGDRQDAARGRAATPTSPALEITTCLRGGELEIDVRHREGRGRRRPTPCAPRSRQRHGPLPVQRGRDHDRRAGRAAPARATGRASPSRAAAGLLAARLTGVPGASEYVAGSVVAYSNQAKSDLLGRRPSADRAPRRRLARGRRGDGRRRAGALPTPTSPSRSPGSRAPRAAPRRSRSATSASAPSSPDGRSLARDPVIPGGREDIRERSALVGMHMLRVLLRRRGAAAVDARSAGEPEPFEIDVAERGPRRPADAPRPDPLADAARRGGMGARRRHRLPARALRTLGRAATTGARSSRRLNGSREPPLERPPPDPGARRGRAGCR